MLNLFKAVFTNEGKKDTVVYSAFYDGMPCELRPGDKISVYPIDYDGRERKENSPVFRLTLTPREEIERRSKKNSNRGMNHNTDAY
jgi:hypothetical protein